jgi:hypothetical protein
VVGQPGDSDSELSYRPVASYFFFNGGKKESDGPVSVPLARVKFTAPAWPGHVRLTVVPLVAYVQSPDCPANVMVALPPDLSTSTIEPVVSAYVPVTPPPQPAAQIIATALAAANTPVKILMRNIVFIVFIFIPAPLV